MRQVPGRHIPVAVTGSPEVGVGPMDLGLSGAGGVEGGADVAVQEHVIPGWLAGLKGGRLRHGAATASSARQPKSGIIGVGNGFLTSYSVNAAVGEIPTADVEIEGLNVRVYANVTGDAVIPAIRPADGTSLTGTFFRLPLATSVTGVDIPMALQPGDINFSLSNDDVIGFEGADLKVQDFTLSFDLARTPLQKLGSRFAFSREIDFPVTATLEVNAEVGEVRDGSLAELICDQSEKEFVISMKEPGCGADKSTALAYVFKGAKLVSQTFSSAIGDNVTMSATYEVQLGGPGDVSKGIFISGSHK